MSQLEPLTQEEIKWAEYVKDVLCNYVGKDNPILNKQLAGCISGHYNTTVTGPRIRKIIAFLRHKKYPICASNKGYYWAKDNNELKAYATCLKDRLVSTRQTLLSIIETIEDGE